MAPKATPDDQKYFGPSDTENRTYEAAQYLIPLLDSKINREELAKLRALPSPDYGPHIETPIVIPLESGLFETKIMRTTQVNFDLCFGTRCYDTWPSSKAGWLVYDEDSSGEIRSGLQMFGSYSFFLFWKNGYEALSALDDNHDGELSGQELQNLAVWQDKNCDGKSDKSEVLPLSKLGIVALSCRGSIDKQGILVSERGVKFASGEARNSYDVILHDKKTHTLALHNRKLIISSSGRVR